MTYYFVAPLDAEKAAKGSFNDCRILAQQLTSSDDYKTLYVVSSRAGEPDATLILEFNPDGCRQYKSRRRLSRQVPLQLSKKPPLSLIVTSSGG